METPSPPLCTTHVLPKRQRAGEVGKRVPAVRPAPSRATAYPLPSNFYNLSLPASPDLGPQPQDVAVEVDG